MALKTKRDTFRIPDSLTHNAGVITAVLGGISYDVTLSGLTANTLYFLYVRDNAGFDLFFDTDVPSVYRVTFEDAILVGAFYSDGTGSPAFGSFVNIEGVPETEDRLEYIPTIQGGGTITGLSAFWERSGNGLALSGVFTTGTPSATEAQLEIPFTVKTGITTEQVGDAQKVNNTSGILPLLQTGGDTFLNFGGGRTGSAVSTIVPQNGNTVFVSSQTYNFFTIFDISIEEFSNTSLKDL